MVHDVLFILFINQSNFTVLSAVQSPFLSLLTSKAHRQASTYTASAEVSFKFSRLAAWSQCLCSVPSLPSNSLAGVFAYFFF